MAAARILFFGNPLHGDDGFGPAVYEEIVRREVSLTAELIYVETAGLSALNHMVDCEDVVLVDAVHDPTRAGVIAELSPLDLMGEGMPYSTHAVGVPFLLRALSCLDQHKPARIRILGAYTCAPTSFTMSLSPLVAAAVEPAVAWICREYGQLERPNLLGS